MVVRQTGKLLAMNCKSLCLSFLALILTWAQETIFLEEVNQVSDCTAFTYIYNLML